MANEVVAAPPIVPLGFIEKIINSITTQSSQVTLNIFWAIIILFVGYAFSKVLLSFIGAILRKTKMDAIIISFLLSIARAIILLMIFIAVLKQLGFYTDSLVALIGAAGLAIGFALQTSLQNFAAGFMLIIFKPFKNGDFVELANTSGVVEKINIFSTTLRSPDNKEITVSNGAIYANTIVNCSSRETRRIDLVVGISYDSDLKKAKNLILEMIQNNIKIIKDPAPLVAVSELAASSVNLVIQVWVVNSEYADIKFDLTEKIKLTFDANEIIIPYPQMYVHLNKVN